MLGLSTRGRAEDAQSQQHPSSDNMDLTTVVEAMIKSVCTCVDLELVVFSCLPATNLICHLSSTELLVLQSSSLFVDTSLVEATQRCKTLCAEG